MFQLRPYMTFPKYVSFTLARFPKILQLYRKTSFVNRADMVLSVAASPAAHLFP